jgi:hypothetical protein
MPGQERGAVALNAGALADADALAAADTEDSLREGIMQRCASLGLRLWHFRS